MHAGVHTDTGTRNASCPRLIDANGEPASTSTSIKRRRPLFLAFPTTKFPPNQKSTVSRLAEESAAMGGGNAQKSKMAREKNLEKLKGGKGNVTLIPLFLFLFGSCRLLDLILSCPLLLILCREPARGQQEGHEHPGA